MQQVFSLDVFLIHRSGSIKDLIAIIKLFCVLNVLNYRR